MADGNREKTANAPLVAVLAADTDFHEHLGRTFPHFAGAKDAFADPTRREQAARFNATLQIGYFLLGVRAAGLAAGPMGGFDSDALDAEFFAGTSLKSLLVVNIGRLAEQYPDEQQRSIATLVDQVQGALDEAHAAGQLDRVPAKGDAAAIYHLTVSPMENHIALGTRPSRAEVRGVVDFALRALGASSAAR